MLIKRNSKKYVIDKNVANDTLKNVFEACELEPNTKPLETIQVIYIVNATLVRVGMWISAALLVVVLLMPLAFVSSKRADDGLGQELKVEVTNHYMDKEHGCFVMELNGEGIDYNGIYAVDENGDTVFPRDIDEAAHLVKLPFTKGSLNIYIPKVDGTYLQAVLSDI